MFLPSATSSTPSFDFEQPETTAASLTAIAGTSSRRRLKEVGASPLLGPGLSYLDLRQSPNFTLGVVRFPSQSSAYRCAYDIANRPTG
jgi:hypothetical protein